MPAGSIMCLTEIGECDKCRYWKISCLLEIYECYKGWCCTSSTWSDETSIRWMNFCSPLEFCSLFVSLHVRIPRSLAFLPIFFFTGLFILLVLWRTIAKLVSHPYHMISPKANFLKPSACWKRRYNSILYRILRAQSCVFLSCRQNEVAPSLNWLVDLRHRLQFPKPKKVQMMDARIQ